MTEVQIKKLFEGCTTEKTVYQRLKKYGLVYEDARAMGECDYFNISAESPMHNLIFCKCETWEGNKMKTYQENKSRVREMAIDWQIEASENDYSYGELADFQDIFYRLGKRYGLLKEFRENGIPC